MINIGLIDILPIDGPHLRANFAFFLLNQAECTRIYHQNMLTLKEGVSTLKEEFSTQKEDLVRITTRLDDQETRLDKMGNLIQLFINW